MNPAASAATEGHTMKLVGVDVGSTTVKAVVVEEGRVL